MKLEETRQSLLMFLQGLNVAEWHTAVQTEDAAWNVADIVRHLINAEKGMTGLIEQFQQGNNPVPPDFDRERYNRRAVEKTATMTPPEVLAALAENRTHLRQVIAGLTAEDWQKKGRHASLRIMTVEEVLQMIADHEQAHLEEMQQRIQGGTDTRLVE
ncbi:MAG: DinB family protein [Chloroflexi bacterium]|nr:DinB family protein [Chloroflexota bacterium]